MHDVISYLDRVDPAAAARARERYACFEQFSGDDAQVYGFAAAFGAGEECEQAVVEQLVDLQRHAAQYARRDGLIAEDELFYAEQNARTVRAADQFDAVIHVDETRATEPLERTAGWETGEVPETYPFAV